MVMEAVAIRVRKQDAEDRKKAEEEAAKKEFKQNAKEALGKYQ